MTHDELTVKISINIEKFRRTWPDIFAPPSNDCAIRGLQQILTELEERQ